MPGPPPPPRSPRPSRPMLHLPPPDPRRDPTDPPPPAEDYRELAIALGAANVAMPRIDERLERIERALEQRPPAVAGDPYRQLPPQRDRLISQHDAEELVATATKSERVRGIVQRTALEAGGRVLLWAVGIAGALVIAGVVGYVLRDCAARGAPVTAPAH